tara:strand:+ start:97013 stop:98896 length:1884 start_codon:yes stop_codon:yes gene_type:complete
MKSNLKNFFLFIKNNRLFLSEKIEIDSKTRNVNSTMIDGNIAIFKNKDLIYEIELNDNKEDSLEIDLKIIWNEIVKKNQIIEIKEFIKTALFIYKFTTLSEFNNFISKFNLDFTFFKLLNDKQVYINSPEIVNKIENNINNKDKNKLLNNEFITLLRDKKNFNSDKFTFQIENIRKFIENKKAYDKGLISKIKKEFNIENNNELLDFFLVKNLFKIKDIISMKFNLNSSFSYNYKSNKINDDNPIDAFTIDDEKTVDYDDAISFSKTDEGSVVSIHISNFSKIIDYNSGIDTEASKRMQSIYSPYGNYNLYSDDIISDISLRKGEIREVISISFLVDRDYKIISHEILKNKIKITNNYSYKEIDSFIEKDEIFKNLQKFTTKHRQDRVNNADFEQFNKDISLHLNDNNLLELKVSNFESYQIISELMIMANSYIAQFMYKNKIPSIYRKQLESPNLVINSFEDEFPFQFFRNVSPIDVSTTPGTHSGLGVDNYVQFTSPIRRYHDSLLMRQLDYFLESRLHLFNTEELNKIIQNTNSDLESSKNKSKNLYKFCALRFLLDNKNYSSDVYIYNELKNSYIIYFNQLNIFDIVDKNQLKKSYSINDKLTIKYEFIDLINLTFGNIEEVL